MAIIVVGGHSRGVGKTSVVVGLISRLPQFRWTAIKITQYGHGICSANGQACDCATGDHSWAVSEEHNRDGKSDSSRFLIAGAAHAWWVRTEQGRLAEALPRVRRILSASPHVIVESNSILRFLKPDLYLTVLDPHTADFKSSAQPFLDRADVLLLHANNGNPHRAWQNISLKPAANRPTFLIRPPQFVTAEVVDFVRGRLLTIRD